MADATVTVAATESWLKQHERLIIIFMVLAVGGWLVNHYLNHVDTLDKQKQTAAETQLADQKAANAQLQTKINETVQEYETQLATITQQNAKLASSIQTRNTALSQQQAIDKTAAPSYLLTRWKDIMGTSVPDIDNAITITPTGANVSQPAAEATVAQLEQIPVLQQNVNDLEKEDASNKDELTTANQLIGQQKTQIDGLYKEVNDNEKACTATVNTLKIEAKKGKLKWFGIGYVSGFISGLLLK